MKFAIRDESAASVRKRFDKGIELLSKSVSKDILLSQILLTPSCGTGSRSIDETEKVFRILVELKKALTADYI